MSTSEIILFEFGTEGGGAIVYKLLSNEIVEKGSSGGILDEEEDPVIQWERKFDSWEAWWSNFISEHKVNWIHFYPVFIHEEINAYIKSAVDNYQITDQRDSYYKNNWLRRLNEKFKL